MGIMNANYVERNGSRMSDIKRIKKVEKKEMSEMIDLYARNPFQHDMDEKVMGYNWCPFRFIFGIIVGREHRGESNVYTIKSDYEDGKKFSGTLFEGEIKPYDENLVLEEIRRTVGNDKTRVLTVKVTDYRGVCIIVEEKGKEVLNKEIEGDDIEPGDLLKSYEELLTYLGWKPDMDRMYLGDGLLALNFIKVCEKPSRLNGMAK